MNAKFLLLLSVFTVYCAYKPVDGQLGFINCPAKIASALLWRMSKEITRASRSSEYCRTGD